MEKISVIIPVYNTARYLRKCIDSVLAQTYKEVEIVLVNDCSTDGSLQLMRRYEARHPNVVVVNKEQNEGVDRARITGLAHATGSLVTFVDSDDYLDHDALERLYNTMKREDVDVVVADCKKFMNIMPFYKREPRQTDSRYTGRRIGHEELMSDLYISYFGVNIVNVAVWGKLYRRHLLDGLQATGLRFGEDLIMNMTIFPRINALYIMPDSLYNYRQSGGTSRFMPYFMDNCRALYRLKMQAIEQHNYRKATRYARIELKNCLKTFVLSLIFFNRGVEYPCGVAAPGIPASGICRFQQHVEPTRPPMQRNRHSHIPTRRRACLQADTRHLPPPLAPQPSEKALPATWHLSATPLAIHAQEGHTPHTNPNSAGVRIFFSRKPVGTLPPRLVFLSAGLQPAPRRHIGLCRGEAGNMAADGKKKRRKGLEKTHDMPGLPTAGPSRAKPTPHPAVWATASGQTA